MESHLSELIHKIGSPRVLVVGDLVLDRYAWGEAGRISPEAPIPVLNLKNTESRPGGAANVVSVLSHLGATVSCCGVVGDDGDGKTLTQMIQELCQGTTKTIIDARRPTTVKTRFIGYVQSARRAMHHILRVDSEDVTPVTGEVEARIVSFLAEAIPQQDVVLVSDYEKGVLSERVMQELTRIARQAKVPVMADPKLGRAPQFYAGVTLMTPNRYETQMLTGIAVRDAETMEQAARKLVPAVAQGAVLITLDRDGMYLFEAGNERGIQIKMQPREVYDVTGAGDVVISVMALMRASGCSFIEAAEIANVAAGIEVGKVGASPVYREEILNELLLREGTAPTKLKNAHDLTAVLEERRRRGETIVFTNGCFDLLHVGHIELLKFARRQGDLLVVGLNSDKSVQALKGPTRPIVNQKERAHVLAALEVVDYIVIFDEPSVGPTVELVKPDVLVKGTDWADKGVIGTEFVEARGGRVVLCPLIEGLSTTNIVAKILDVHRAEGDTERASS